MNTRNLLDVVVVGGGAVGASAAAALAQSGFDVALIEPNAPIAAGDDAPLDARVIALSPASTRFVERLGAWPLAAARAFAYRDMDVRAGDEELLSQQYYVCVAANPKDALWMPLFAGPGPGRKGIAASAKSGHVQWTKHSSFYRPGTLFRVPHKATQQAAEAASDRSTPKTANRIALDQMLCKVEALRRRCGRLRGHQVLLIRSPGSALVRRCLRLRQSRSSPACDKFYRVNGAAAIASSTEASAWTAERR